MQPRIPFHFRHWLLALCLLVFLAPAWAQKRVALLVGNGQYQHESVLANPVSDVRLLASVLRAAPLNFKVEVLEDLERREMDLTIKRFVRESGGADTALLYYAGHGAQPTKGGRSYLLPVNAKAVDDDSLETDGILAETIAAQLEQQANPAKLRLVVLDACRNTRMASSTRSTVRGLAPPARTDSYTLIAYSTDANSVAQDGALGNSPYAKALAQHLPRAAREPVRVIFEDTAKDVRAATRQAQAPRTYGDLESRVGLDGLQLASLVVEPTGNPNIPIPATGKPSQSGTVSLDDLEKEEATRKEWANWQARMKADYDKTAAFNGSADLQAKAWERFLTNWSQDNPLSREDDNLRGQAQQRQSSARAQAQALAQAPVQTQPLPITPKFSPGQAFKDCADCPEMVVIPAGSGIAAFAIGQTEVTQGQWQAVMGNNPSDFKACGSDCPLEQVSWDDAQAFIRKLNAKTGKTYRLPSEQEWEHACLGGLQTEYCGGNSVDAVAWYGQNSNNTTHRVRTKQPNGYGLYDMSGNVWEWTDSCWEGDCGQRVLRGGSWIYLATFTRAAFRDRITSTYRNYSIGFRLARIAP